MAEQDKAAVASAAAAEQAAADTAAREAGFQGAADQARWEAEVALPTHFSSGLAADMVVGTVDGQPHPTHSTACGLQVPPQTGPRIRTTDDVGDVSCPGCQKALKPKPRKAARK